LEINKSIDNNQLIIKVEESKHLSLTASDVNSELVMLDNIFLPNGESYVVTKVSEDGSVELMKRGRLTVKKEELSTFLEGALIDRAECFLS